MVASSHGHEHLWKWGSWPLPLKCQVRDWGRRRMAVGVCGTGGRGGREWGGGVKGSGIRDLGHVVPYRDQVITEESETVRLSATSAIFPVFC